MNNEAALSINEEKETSEITLNDDLQSFLLRSRLSDMNFSYVWRVMPALGWKFNGLEYITPSGINVGSSLVAMERLDFGLPCLSLRTNNGDRNGIISKGNDFDNNVDVEMQNKLRKERIDLLSAIFNILDEKSRRFSDTDDDDNDDDNDNSSIDQDDNVSKSTEIYHGEKKKDLTSKKRKQSTSVTTNEPGTEQFFANSKGPRTRRSKRLNSDPSKNIEIHAIANNDNDKNTSTSKLLWPNPRDNVQTMQAMRRNDGSEKYDIKRVRQLLRKNLLEWKFLLTTNHCLLLHGFGSKKLLLNEFASELRKFGDVLTLDANDPDINIRQILDVFVTLFLDGIEPTALEPMFTIQDESIHCKSEVVKRAIRISRTLGKRRNEPIHLVIHNIDAMGLSDQESQDAITSLVRYCNVVSEESCSFETSTVFQPERVVRLIASTDHVDATAFLWDMNQIASFSWIWKEINTFCPYYDEVKTGINDETRKIKATQRQVLDYVFIQKVLKSIAPKHTEIIKELCKLQISKGKGDTYSSIGKNSYIWVNFNEWNSVCKNKMIATKADEFRSMVRELKDHGMIEYRDENSEGNSFVCIPTNMAKVLDILRSL